MTEPDVSEEWLDDIFDAVVSDVQATGWFDLVNEFEPKKAPGNGLTAAIWIDRITAQRGASSLIKTSARLIFNIRAQTNMLTEPQDTIDRNLMKAVSSLLRRYHDDFDFEGAIRNVDILGEFGQPLDAVAGYIDQDGTKYRAILITLPLIVNDVWTQNSSSS